MSDDDPDACSADTVEAIVARIKPLLAGHRPEIQSAALADLLSLWLVGFPNVLRPELLTQHMHVVRELLPANEALVHGPHGHPDNT